MPLENKEQDMNEPVPVKTADTVFAVVEALVDLEEADLSELVARLDMPRSTVHDHLRSLEELGLVTRPDGNYQASLRFLDIAERMRRQRDVYRAGQTQARQLSREVGEHASLMVEENGLGVLLYLTRAEDAVELGARDGLHLELHTNAAGKTIFAFLPEDRREEIIDEHGLPSYTPETITDREELAAELERIRERGYATSTDELMEGVRAVAAPITSRGEIRGAIAVGGPRRRMRGTRFEEELPNKVLQASNVVELNLSYG